jgi:hypothetical protein
MSTPPHFDPANNPKRRAADRDSNPTPSEVCGLVIGFLKHYWDAPRQKSKWTDIATVVLTVLIAGAAIYSAFIFQAQLDASRKAFRVDQRARIGPIEALSPQFIENGVPVYMKAGEQAYLLCFWPTPARLQPLMLTSE